MDRAWGLIKDSVNGWINDRAPRKGAALAFYTVFSLAPLLIITIAVAGLILGEHAARGEIVAQIEDLMGRTGAEAIESIISNSQQKSTGTLATVLGLMTLVVGATTVLAELKDALDQLWEVPAEKTSGLWYFVKTRLLSLSIILAIGFLLIVSLIVTAFVSGLGKFASDYGIPAVLIRTADFVLSYALVTALFAIIYKVMPSISIAWRDVIVGSLITAALFTIGKFLLGFYLGRSAIASSYGAAGSFILVLIWVYYSAQIFFLGAEFTKFYAYRYGSRANRSEAGRILQASRPPSELRAAQNEAANPPRQRRAPTD
jgi:membrane protein